MSELNSRWKIPKYSVAEQPNGSAIRLEDKPHVFVSLWAKTSVISDIVNFLVTS